eukprot:COSAG04_NODE_1202_length_7763_cov_21.569285_5_plen_59_part_00
MTILWGRDGWEKFVALCIFSVALVFQLVGLFGTVRWSSAPSEQCRASAFHSPAVGRGG